MSKARDALKRIIGSVAEFTHPELGREIDEARNTTRAVKVKRAIHYARLRRAQAAGDIDALEGVLSAFWKGEPGNAFHDRFIEARVDYFLKYHTAIVEALRDLPAVSGLRPTRLVEIGCGDGKALAYCLERLPWVTQAVGLDINEAVIARNSDDGTFDRKISFVATDAREWLTENALPGTVAFTNGGVFEYFSQESFDRTVAALSASKPAAIALIEPVAPEHDLARQAESLVFGYERSFSHNHRHRLDRAGFEIVFEREMQIGKVRWMLMIGVAR